MDGVYDKVLTTLARIQFRSLQSVLLIGMNGFHLEKHTAGMNTTFNCISTEWSVMAGLAPTLGCSVTITLPFHAIVVASFAGE